MIKTAHSFIPWILEERYIVVHATKDAPPLYLRTSFTSALVITTGSTERLSLGLGLFYLITANRHLKMVEPGV
jgi:hypothetical protein